MGTACTTLPSSPLAVVVANPTKPALTVGLHERINHTLTHAGYTVRWQETSVAQPGAHQARSAVAAGARLVLAVGGDGTIRSVAAGLVGTGVPLGLIPAGTANLAARNLGIPLGDPRAAVDIATTAQPHPTDIIWVSTVAEPTFIPEPPGGWAQPTTGQEHACLVVTGLGFDAELVAATSPALKARIAWGAYAVAAMRRLGSPRVGMTVYLDSERRPHGRLPHARSGSSVHPTTGGDLAPTPTTSLTARCLLIANAGTLPAGIRLLPQASMDDGQIDVAAIDTVGGLVGWTALAQQVLPPRAAHYRHPRRTLGRVVQHSATHDVAVMLDQPMLVEIDGELVAPTRHLRARIDPGAVLIRRPAPSH